MSFFTIYENLCKEQKSTPSGVANKLNIANSSVNRWRKGAIPRGAALNSIADYFGVSVDYLLGNTEIRNTPYKQTPKEIAQVALFGGDTDVTDEMWEEIREFADYVKAKHKRNN